MKTETIELFFITILSLASVIKAQQIEITDCSSSKEAWVCYSNEICICRISGSCTEGNLMIYKENVQYSFCYPSIENGIAAIYLDECNIPKGEIKVRASCLEGNSVEKIIRIEEKKEPTRNETINATTTLKENVTTSRECSQLGASCAYQACCEGLNCCEDMICKESCEEDRTEPNLWIIIIPVIMFIIVVVSFLIIKKRGEIE